VTKTIACASAAPGNLRQQDRGMPVAERWFPPGDEVGGTHCLAWAPGLIPIKIGEKPCTMKTRSTLSCRRVGHPSSEAA